MKVSSATVAAVHELAAAIADDPGARVKTCPACGVAFHCLPGNCWCAALRLTGATLGLLKKKHEGCLCPSCLLPYSE